MPLKVDVLRDRSTLAREADDGSIENNYQLQLVNASEQPRRYTVQVAGLEGIRLSQPAQVSLAAASTGTLTLQIRVDAGSADKGAHPITLTVQDEADATIAPHHLDLGRGARDRQHRRQRDLQRIGDPCRRRQAGVPFAAFDLRQGRPGHAAERRQ